MGKQKQEPGKCVFCDGHGLTKEHIWSEWLRGVLPDTTDFPTWFRTWEPSPHAPATRFTSQTKKLQGSVNARKLRRVCKACNNGWMSRIVQAAKPIAEPLIRGEATHLGATEMARLALWVGLAVAVKDIDDTGSPATTRQDREHIRVSNTLPPAWCVYAGRYDGSKWGPITFHRHRFRVRDFGPTGAATSPTVVDHWQVATYNLGRLLVHVLTARMQETATEFRLFHRPGPMCLLWPTEADHSADWPPGGAGFGDAEANLLADGFYKAHGGNPLS